MARPDDIAEQFRSCMETLESASDVEPLLELYSPDCSVGNIVDGEQFKGLDGAREFWTTYRQLFDDVRSEFHVVAGDESGAVVEWTTTGSSAGDSVSYRGVTVLELQDGAIVRSMAYYDSASLGRQVVGTPESKPDD